jgi:hypothetical protein
LLKRPEEFAKFALSGNENDAAAGLASGLKGGSNDTPGEVELPKPIAAADPKRARHFAMIPKRQ